VIDEGCAVTTTGGCEAGIAVGAAGAAGAMEGSAGGATGGVAGAGDAPKPSFSRQLRSGAGADGATSAAGDEVAGAEGAGVAGDGSAAVFFLKKLNMLEGGLRRYIM